MDYSLDLFGAPKLKVTAFDDCIDISQLTICTLADGSRKLLRASGEHSS